ncbi:hypothetical protein FGO68_gene3227 [Halteria grandinella]|uniref:Uncharacterized protein n=1 Tax=Halteria grandinella TaxID=5974 RepID=A0A8J8NUP9_HALGN|nr:hypothetical protein FGO68_gene3227 [Halteria grandinella]
MPICMFKCISSIKTSCINLSKLEMIRQNCSSKSWPLRIPINAKMIPQKNKISQQQRTQKRLRASSINLSSRTISLILKQISQFLSQEAIRVRSQSSRRSKQLMRPAST